MNQSVKREKFVAFYQWDGHVHNLANTFIADFDHVSIYFKQALLLTKYGLTQ